MMLLKIILAIIFGTAFVNAEQLNIIAFSSSGYESFFKEMVDRFNKHSEETKMNISLKLDIISHKNQKMYENEFEDKIKKSLKRKTQNYDLYSFDTIYSGSFSERLINLKGINDEIDKLYEKEKDKILKPYIINDSLVSLPLFADYGILISNRKLLEKYNETVPKTWDDLILKAQRILKEEEKLGNKNIAGYIPYIPDTESAICSELEFIYSYRDINENEFPSFKNKSSEEAINKLKEIKTKISTDEYFQYDDKELTSKIEKGEFIFAKYWNIYESNENLIVSALPGKYDNKSASCIGGYSVSISKYVTEEKEEKAKKVIEVLMSNKFQRENLIINNRHPTIEVSSIYDDTEVCSKTDCDLYKNIQGIVRPSEITSYNNYSKKFRKAMMETIFGQKSTNETLEYISKLLSKDYVRSTSIPGIITILLTFLVMASTLISYVYVTIKRTQNVFGFLTYNYWCVFLLGIFLLSCYTLTVLEQMSKIHCISKPIILNFGFSLTTIPFFLKLIEIYPTKNKLSDSIKKHYTIYFLFFMLTDFLIVICYMNNDFSKFYVIVPENDNPRFDACKVNKSIESVIGLIYMQLRVFILCTMVVLLIIERKIEEYHNEIRILIPVTIMDIVLIFSYYTVKEFKFFNSNLYFYLGVRTTPIVLYCVINLILLIGVKYYNITIKKTNTWQYDHFAINSEYRKNSSESSNTMSNSLPTVLTEQMITEQMITEQMMTEQMITEKMITEQMINQQKAIRQSLYNSENEKLPFVHRNSRKTKSNISEDSDLIDHNNSQENINKSLKILNNILEKRNDIDYSLNGLNSSNRLSPTNDIMYNRTSNSKLYERK